MRAFKVFRSNLTSVWYRHSIISIHNYPDHKFISHHWELNKPNTFEKLYASLSIKRAIYWVLSAISEYRNDFPDLIICEVDVQDIIRIKKGDIVCHTITPIRIIPTQEYFNRIPTTDRFFTQIVRSIR